MIISAVFAETGPVTHGGNEFLWGNIVIILVVTMLVWWLVRAVTSARRTAKRASFDVAQLRQEMNNTKPAVRS